MIDARLLQQLHTHLQRLQRPVLLEATLDDSPPAQRLRGLLEQIAGLHPDIALSLKPAPSAAQALRVPSFSVGPQGEAARVHLAGVPLGHDGNILRL